MKRINQKGNLNGLQAFVMAIIGVSIVLAIAFMLLAEISSAAYTCPTANHTSFNVSSGLCYNPSNASETTAELSGAGASLTTITTKMSNIPSWIGIIIVVTLASLVLGYFYVKR